MAIVVASGSAVALTASTKTADQVTGRNQYVGPGVLQVIAKSSATAVNMTVNVGGIALIDDQVIPYTGTAGTISTRDNVVIEQKVAGGRVECFFRETAAGAGKTVDFLILFTPTK